MSDNAEGKGFDLDFDDVVIPRMVSASAVEFHGGTRLLLLEFEGFNKACRILVSRDGAEVLEARLTETLLTWNGLR